MNRLSPMSQHLRNIAPSSTGDFTPKSIFGTDLESWHDARLGVTIDGSNRVSDWADQTGNGHHLVQTTSGARPDYVTTGGLNNGPYINSGTYGTAYLQFTGSIVTVNTGNWGIVGVFGSSLSTSLRVMTTTLTVPSGCVASAFRIALTSNDMNFQQIGISVPTAVAVTSPDMLPVGTWCGAAATITAAGSRTLTTFGEGTTGTSTTSHTGNIGTNLCEGYVAARFTATFYQEIRVQQLWMISRTITTADLTQIRTYLRTQGLNT